MSKHDKSQPMGRVFFFDLLRCVAAIAVVGIHVLAPYRHELGSIPLNEWLTAISVNGMSRWAVPVFIMISGALMLSDPRPFNAKHYLRRRVGKVVIPFLVWSLFYSFLSGWSSQGFDVTVFKDVLFNSYQHETYYHLGFFYYFIPLYFVIPFLHLAVKRYDDTAMSILLLLWLCTTGMYLFWIDGYWSSELWLYSGYLLLGYFFYQVIPITKVTITLVIILGCIGLGASVLMVAIESMARNQYTVDRWLSYKTINTVCAAAMIFMLCRAFADKLSQSAQNTVSVVSQHSLGIYILHPIFLWPVKEFGWDNGHPLYMIPIWTIFSGGAALLTSMLLSASPRTFWLLPK